MMGIAIAMASSRVAVRSLCKVVLKSALVSSIIRTRDWSMRTITSRRQCHRIATVIGRAGCRGVGPRILLLASGLFQEIVDSTDVRVGVLRAGRSADTAPSAARFVEPLS
jgi:hypothetical protein